MLINFKAENFKSFRDGFNFKMTPEKRMNELKYSLLSESIRNQNVQTLSVSVVYGPNASGKTSIVNAMSCMRQIIIRGNINDAREDRSGDNVSRDMNMVPFAFLDKATPVNFDVSFTFHKTKYRYAISLHLGTFLQEDAERYLEREQLFVNDKLIFDRTRNAVDSLNLESIKEMLNTSYDILDAERTKKMMSSNIVQDTLLLTTDFNSFCSKKIVNEIVTWFTKQFIVVNSSNRTRFYPSMSEDEGKAMINNYINRIAQEAGIIGSDFAYIYDPESHATKVLSVLKKEGDELYGIDADRIESVGTLRLIAIMPVIISALRRGATLVIDELDASLHPMIVMNLISIFHNNSVNVNKAQLIFNSHNPIFLNHDLLRRDEIKFVERDEMTKSSTLYSLSDFKANGEASVRKTSDYMKNYFINRYGAIVDIDFTDIISDILKGDDKDE